MTNQISQDEINNILWQACDTFRGTMGPSFYKDYILVMLFLKYISDVWQEKYATLLEKYNGDEERAQRELGYERFKLPENCDFYAIYDQRNEANLGEIIDIALDAIADANKEKLEGVFRNISFNSEANLGQKRQRNEHIKYLVEMFNDPHLDMRPSRANHLDVVNSVFTFIVTRFPSVRVNHTGEFYTPSIVGQLMAKILNPQSGESICDPACGSGILLVNCLREMPSDNYTLFGQEIQFDTWRICLFNLIFQGIDIQKQEIKFGNTLTHPLEEQGNLRHFDGVIANIPMSTSWDPREAHKDPFRRFKRGIPPKNRSDYAFISHIVETLNETGRAVILVSHSILFRGGIEGEIRQQLIEENLLDAVIGLPENLFWGTSIPVAILIFKRNKEDDTVMFIDASRDYQKDTPVNTLRGDDIEKVLGAYRNRVSINGYAHVAERDEIEANDYNLNIARYIFAYEMLDEQIIISTGPNQYDVFVSYSHKNKDFKDKLVEELLKAGLRVWDDDAYTLEVGTSDWQMQIEKAIEAATCLIVLLSPDAKESTWVRREIMYAEIHKKDIFPILVEGNEQSSIPLLLIGSQRIDLQPTAQHQVDNLIDALKQKVGILKIRTPFIYDLMKKQPNWKEHKLGEIVEITSPKQRINSKSITVEGTGYPVYGLNGIIGYHSEYEFEGDYLIVPNRFTSAHEKFTKNALVPESDRFSLSQGMCAIKPSTSISINFLLYSLWITDFRPFVETSTMKRVVLKDIRIAVPALNEQIEIVEYLAEQMRVVNERQDQLRTRISILDSRKIGMIHKRFNLL